MSNLLTRTQLAQYVPARVLAFADVIAKTEGGYVNDQADHGGATNEGISLRWANGHGQEFDLNHDGRVDVSDIRLITPEIAACAFVQFFFLDTALTLLPDAIQNNAFDTSVNCGPGVPVGLAQRAYNLLHDRSDALRNQSRALLRVDGQLGGVSVKALHQAAVACGDQALNAAFCDVRIQHYHEIVAHDQSQAKFLDGWVGRANHLRDLSIEDTDAAPSIEENHDV